jgi:hypothetical protein
MNDVDTTVRVGVSEFDGNATTLSQQISVKTTKKAKSRHYKIQIFSGDIVDFIEDFLGGVGWAVEPG